MVKIRYLQRTHDSEPGNVKAVDEPCARVLVLLGKAEYFADERVSTRKSKRKVESA